MQNATIDQGKVNINDTHTRTPKAKSQFNLNYPFFNTYRYGEIAPFFWMEGVGKDKLPLRSAHEVQSYTLGQPLMSTIKMIKSYFMVPREAILPFNWDKIHENPTAGDDINAQEYGTNTQFLQLIKSITTTVNNTIQSVIESEYDPVKNYDLYTYILNYMIFLESIFSKGSLFESLGIHLGSIFKYSYDGTTYKNFDQLFDAFINLTINTFKTSNTKYLIAGVGTDTYQIWLDGEKEGYISFRDFLDIIRHETLIRIQVGTGGDNQDFEILNSWILDNYILTPGVNGLNQINDNTKGIDLARLWAYQIVVSHYYSNDFIDYIYSAELYRQKVYSHIRYALDYAADTDKIFLYNGIQTRCDTLSATYVKYMLNYFKGLTIENDSDQIINFFDYWKSLTSYGNSLKYVDYFTGAKSKPLAVGDVNTPVVANAVNAIDMTRNIMKQRFLNAVQRAGRKTGEYMKAIFDVENYHPDYHNPFFIAETSDHIRGQINENTGEAQMSLENSRTSTLYGSSDKWVFEFEGDRDCIILGLVSFNIERAYIDTIERQVFHVNRYDMFNPFMQTIGDQEVYAMEHKSSDTNPASDNYAYQGRHMEYKQRYAQAAGGFASGALPGWAFVQGDTDGHRTLSTAEHITPSVIRSHPSELDKYYLALTGYSLGTYFHFIIKSDNIMPAERPMIYNPGIL